MLPAVPYGTAHLYGGVRVCDRRACRQTQRVCTCRVHPLAEGMQCLWGSGPRVTPPRHESYPQPAPPPRSHQQQVRTHMPLTLMENLPCDSWRGQSEQACDSEGGQAKLPLHREEAPSGATTPTRRASETQGQDSRSLAHQPQENARACGRQPATPHPIGGPASRGAAVSGSTPEFQAFGNGAAAGTGWDLSPPPPPQKPVP